MSSTEWVARVDLVDEPTDENISAIHEHLQTEYGASVGADPGGRLSVTIGLSAGTVRAAVEIALKVVTAAAVDSGLRSRRGVVGVEVVSSDEIHRRIDEPLVPDLVGVSDIARMFGVSQQRASQLVQREDFPPEVGHISASPIFVRSQVEAFSDRWERRSGRPKKSA